MMKVLITGAESYIGVSVEHWLRERYCIDVDTVDTKSDAWQHADFSSYDCVYHVAGIAHVDADPKMEPLYYKVNRDLALDVARKAKESGVKQFVFMSSMIVYRESQSLKTVVITDKTSPVPDGFYGGSKLQAEERLHDLENNTFKVCILRPPIVYGPGCKGNFPRLIKLAKMSWFFPDWHNRRSMIYIDNLCEFVYHAIINELRGTYYPQNKELSDTVEIVRFFAGHRVWFSRLFNPFVWLFAKFLQPLNKMFGTYYYDPEMSKMDFDYQVVSLEDSLLAIVNDK